MTMELPSAMNDASDPITNPPKPGSGPSLLACLLCRHKHLKCDGQTPVCGRCQATGSECLYTPSRRGYNSKKRRANPISPELMAAAGPELTASFDGADAQVMQPVGGLWDIPADWGYQGSGVGAGVGAGGYAQAQTASVAMPSSSSSQSPTAFLPDVVGGTGPLTPDSSSSSPAAADGYLVEVYYNYFHSAHPILQPLRSLNRSCVPPYLEQVIKFIGSHYTPTVSSETYRATVVPLVMEQDATVEKVQALTLLAIVLHSRNERTEAGECLYLAVDLAFDLGLHRAHYASTMGDGDLLREESLRRTWWELVVVEGMLTALGVQKTFRTNSIPCHEVGLPCEERIFTDNPHLPAQPRTPATIAQFDARIFADEEHDFSSFTYRIEAIRILGRVVAIQDLREEARQQDHVEAIDARIASFFHHLPEPKAELMRPDGSIDEMMFQATMIVNGAAVYLHFPRSDLLSSPTVAAEVICGHHGPLSIPAFSHHAHAMKAVKAASEISALAALRLPVVKHTPFFICALVLSSIVQLAACSMKAGQMPDPSRDRLTLTIGVFKSLARTWAISQLIMRQIKAVARDVMVVGLRPTVDQLDLNSVLDNGRFWLEIPR